MHSTSTTPATAGVRLRLAYSLLSAVLPGTGQIVAGYRRRGVAMLAVSCVLIVVGVLIYQQGLSTVFSWLVQPRILAIIFLANIAVLLFRLGAVIDAYLAPCRQSEAPDQRSHKATALLALVLVLVFTAAPHAIVGYYTYITHDTLNSVFSSQNITDIQTPEPTTVPENTGG
jgi:hypothetical protein